MMAMKKLSTIMQLTSVLITLLRPVASQIAVTGKANNPNPELVNMLTKKLNVTPQQATGGAGAIFGLVKNHLNSSDFSKVAAAVPGMNGFLRAAPAAGGGSRLGSLGSMLGENPRDLGSLAGSFQSLKLSPSMIGKFAPVPQKYIAGKGGLGAASLFTRALN